MHPIATFAAMGKDRSFCAVGFAVMFFFSVQLSAQFPNTLISQKQRPKVTRAELESDSAHYIDKPNTYREKKTGMVHSVWTEFDKYHSSKPGDSSYIMYSRLTGKNWSKAVRISKHPGDCSNGDNTLKSDNPCTGPGGELYVCWASPRGVAFQRSLDTGKTWLPEEKFIYQIKNGWDQVVEGIKTTGVPRIACAADSGQFRGRIYITWSDEKNGVKNKDVFLVYSDDKGENWTEPILVTYRPNHKEQYNPAIAVQPGTGNVFITYFDRQNYNNGKLSDLYLALSRNGGLKYEYYKVNENPVLPDSNVASVRGLAFVPKSETVKAVWSQITEKNQLGIYSAIINDSTIAEYTKKDSLAEAKMPRMVEFAKKIVFEFTLPSAGKVSAVITKPIDPYFQEIKLLDLEGIAGKNRIDIDTKKLGLKKGNYVMTIYYKGRNSFVWITGE
jgi:hypothetical protein